MSAPEERTRVRELFTAPFPRDDAQGWGRVNHVAFLGERAMGEHGVVARLLDELAAAEERNAELTREREEAIQQAYDMSGDVTRLGERIAELEAQVERMRKGP